MCHRLGCTYNRVEYHLLSNAHCVPYIYHIQQVAIKNHVLPFIAACEERDFAKSILAQHQHSPVTMASTDDVRNYGKDLMASAMKTFRGVLPSYALASKLAAGAFVTFGAACEYKERISLRHCTDLPYVRQYTCQYSPRCLCFSATTANIAITLL